MLYRSQGVGFVEFFFTGIAAESLKRYFCWCFYGDPLKTKEQHEQMPASVEVTGWYRRLVTGRRSSLKQKKTKASASHMR